MIELSCDSRLFQPPRADSDLVTSSNMRSSAGACMETECFIMLAHGGLGIVLASPVFRDAALSPGACAGSLAGAAVIGCAPTPY